jgi:hypothetical protein
MKLLTAILREIKGLFVEDNRLAVAIIGLVAVAVGLFWLEAPDFVVGLTLFAGSLALLVENVLRAGGKPKRPPDPPKA